MRDVGCGRVGEFSECEGAVHSMTKQVVCTKERGRKRRRGRTRRQDDV